MAAVKSVAAVAGSRARLASEIARANSPRAGGGESVRRNENTASPSRGLDRSCERSSSDASGETATRIGKEWSWRAGTGSGSGSWRARREAATEDTAARSWVSVKGGSGGEVEEQDAGLLVPAGSGGGGGGGDQRKEVEGIASGGTETDVNNRGVVEW